MKQWGSRRRQPSCTSRPRSSWRQVRCARQAAGNASGPPAPAAPSSAASVRSPALALPPAPRAPRHRQAARRRRRPCSVSWRGRRMPTAALATATRWAAWPAACLVGCGPLRAPCALPACASRPPGAPLLRRPPRPLSCLPPAARQGRPDHRWEAGAVQQLARLRELQLELQGSSRREGFLGLSAADTVRLCLRLGLKDQAARVAREFKVRRQGGRRGRWVGGRWCRAGSAGPRRNASQAARPCRPAAALALAPLPHHAAPPCSPCTPSHPLGPQIPDRQFALLSARVLAAAHDWPALQALAQRQDRRSGLTMEHFLAAARCAAAAAVAGAAGGQGCSAAQAAGSLTHPAPSLVPLASLPPAPRRSAHGAPPEAQRWFVDHLTGEGALAKRAQARGGGAWRGTGWLCR